MASRELIDAGSLADWLTVELRKQVHQVHCSRCLQGPGLVVGQDIIGKEFTDALAAVVKMAEARFNLV